LIALQDTSALEVSSPSSAVQCKPFYETKDYEIKDYGVTVKPPLRTPDEPLGFVTRTSQARSRGGPPLLVVIVRVIVLALPTITLELVGTGPVPFWKVTTAPWLKLAPVIVALIVLPAFIVSGVMPDTSITAGVAVLVGDGIGVFVGVFVGVLVGGGAGVFVGAFVGVAVDTGVLVGVFVGVLVGDGAGVFVGVFMGVLVGDGAGVFVGVFMGVLVGDGTGVFVGVAVEGGAESCGPNMKSSR